MSQDAPPAHIGDLSKTRKMRLRYEFTCVILGKKAEDTLVAAGGGRFGGLLASTIL